MAKIIKAVKNIDYKDVDTLKMFINPNARILGRKKTNMKATQQRELASAIKRARFMGLLPYIAR
jgi:small subunit ribosomal protein S18